MFVRGLWKSFLFFPLESVISILVDYTFNQRVMLPVAEEEAKIVIIVTCLVSLFFNACHF
jgi:hypothetical protein